MSIVLVLVLVLVIVLAFDRHVTAGSGNSGDDLHIFDLSPLRRATFYSDGVTRYGSGGASYLNPLSPVEPAERSLGEPTRISPPLGPQC
jgi:hypothetical protein